MGAYDDPDIYEVAFSFVDVCRQVNLLLEFVKRYSGVGLSMVLGVGCGPSPQLRELAKRGYDAIGLDINPMMLAHLRKRALEECVIVETFEGDMVDFRVGYKVDLVINLMGTLPRRL
jgi:SAM-dependent methyltransferase